MLSGVVARRPDLFGVAPPVVHGLAGGALALGGWDFLHWSSTRANHRRALRVVALGNIAYCLVTPVALALDARRLTTLRRAYFGGETALVAGLAWLEWRRSWP